jgi:hypothetical protein
VGDLKLLVGYPGDSTLYGPPELSDATGEERRGGGGRGGGGGR